MFPKGGIVWKDTGNQVKAVRDVDKRQILYRSCLLSNAFFVISTSSRKERPHASMICAILLLILPIYLSKPPVHPSWPFSLSQAIQKPVFPGFPNTVNNTAATPMITPAKVHFFTEPTFFLNFVISKAEMESVVSFKSVLCHIPNLKLQFSLFFPEWIEFFSISLISARYAIIQIVFFGESYNKRLISVGKAFRKGRIFNMPPIYLDNASTAYPKALPVADTVRAVSYTHLRWWLWALV